MRILAIFIFMQAFCAALSAQSKQDSSVWYISPMYGLYTGSGTLAKRSTFDVEIGKQWDVFSLGLDFGKNHFENKGAKDTTSYIEIRPSLNVFQQGKFTNTLTIGIGYIVNAQQNILTEFSTGIEFTPNPRFSYNVFFGTYYYSGLRSSGSQNFFGISMMAYINNKRKFRGIFNRK